MIYLATVEAIEYMNQEGKVTDFQIEQEVKRIKSHEFSLDNFMWIEVRLGKNDERKIYHGVKDKDDNGNLKSKEMYYVEFDGNKWIKVTKEA